MSEGLDRIAERHTAPGRGEQVGESRLDSDPHIAVQPLRDRLREPASRVPVGRVLRLPGLPPVAGRTRGRPGRAGGAHFPRRRSAPVHRRRRSWPRGPWSRSRARRCGRAPTRARPSCRRGLSGLSCQGPSLTSVVPSQLTTAPSRSTAARAACLAPPRCSTGDHRAVHLAAPGRWSPGSHRWSRTRTAEGVARGSRPAHSREAGL